MFPDVDMAEVQLSPIPDWEQAETASIEELPTNDVNDSGVVDLGTTLTKRPTANNWFKGVIEPFALPGRKISKAEAELHVMFATEEERPKAKSKKLERQAKSSLLIKVVDITSQEPTGCNRASSDNVHTSLRQRQHKYHPSSI